MCRIGRPDTTAFNPPLAEVQRPGARESERRLPLGKFLLVMGSSVTRGSPSYKSLPSQLLSLRMHVKRRLMHEAEKFFKRTWDDTMPGERMIVAAAPPTNPSPETSHQVRLRLLTATEWAHLGGG